MFLTSLIKRFKNELTTVLLELKKKKNPQARQAVNLPSCSEEAENAVEKAEATLFKAWR